MKSGTTLNNTKAPADIKKTKMREIREDSENTEARVNSSDDEDLGRSQEEINLDKVSAVSETVK
jgi:hypothetical protein